MHFGVYKSNNLIIIYKKIKSLFYYIMSNLDNVYVSCPARMSDGRGNITDWTSHNELLKKMKGDSAISYDFRARLQVSGLKDIENNKFNLCEKNPAGDVVLGEMKLNVNTSGSFLDAFAPLSKNSFFDKDRSMISTKQQMVGLGAVNTGGINEKDLFEKMYWQMYPLSNDEIISIRNKMSEAMKELKAMGGFKFVPANSVDPNAPSAGKILFGDMLKTRAAQTGDILKTVRLDKIASAEQNKQPFKYTDLSQIKAKYNLDDAIVKVLELKLNQIPNRTVDDMYENLINLLIKKIEDTEKMISYG